ncbi:hypothetical protein IV203_020091 [Nitzschia inconspicua]|uniref:Uncharacterized protein n=1 Tax=Nitzschia inconspicua TaxID=303405 RepID=A0A9K3M3R9_9STRA|nr:hypothetical protein IV203_020460 [Nitzschia inconspicua]KAG7371521.1 hypothetical protein IV203_020091 [Nitzschia inconspicua]
MDGLPGGHGRYFLGHDYTAIDEKAQRVELKMETAAKHEDWFVGPLFFLQLHFEGKDYEDYHQHLLELFIEKGSIFGNTIPDDVINEHINILEESYEQENSGNAFRAIVNGIESVTIEEARIVIKPHRPHVDEGALEEKYSIFLDDFFDWSDIDEYKLIEYDDDVAAFLIAEETTHSQVQIPDATEGIGSVSRMELGNSILQQ